MSIVIIGGSGFIGTALIKQLSDKKNVKNVDKRTSAMFPKVTHIADICSKEQLREALPGAELVVLLAAEHRDDVDPISLYYDVNVKGTENVLEVMEELGINRIIFTSSVAIYGLNKVNPDETTVADPFNHYGKSKWDAEEVLRKWYNTNTSQKSLAIIRPTVVFGEGNKGNVYNLLKQIVSGRFMMIGKGLNKKSMAYVENIVAFIVQLINNAQPGYEVYNYADKPDLSTLELTQLIYTQLDKGDKMIRIPYAAGYLGGVAFDILAKVTGKKFPISSIRVKKFCATTQFSADKVRNTGFKAPFTLHEGLKRTVASIMESTT